MHLLAITTRDILAGSALPILVAALVLGIAVLWIVSIYNRLVGLRNRFKNAFAQIDVQLKRRHDLIPNLVETARGYLKHERETLESVVKARTAATVAAQNAAANPADAGAMRALSGAEGGLANALSRLMLVVERYPELKASQNMTRLSEEIASTENKVAFARQAYNDAVTSYNTTRENFPETLFAGLFGFQPAELFILADPAEKTVPKVSF
jgi:LemA protein